jgi:predicted RND superfamily exporter protein
MSADTEFMITPDKSTMRVIVYTNHIDNKQMLELEERAQAWLQEHSSGAISDGISRPLLFAKAGQEIVAKMALASAFTILFITLVMIIGLRSIKYGLLSLIPNLVPPLVIYGFWGLFIKDVDQGLAVTYSLSLGLIIDDTVHIMAKYIKHRRLGFDPTAAVNKALEISAVALINTTLIICTGLLILTFGDFSPNANIAKIMAPIIFLALFFDLFMLPTILIYFDEKMMRRQEAKQLRRAQAMR